MKSNNKNIDKKIKKKIEEYEFDFSDHAWDKMESLMDPTASADDAAPPSRSNFNIFRNLMIMLLLLIVLYFGMPMLSDQDQSPKTTSLPTSELPQTKETNTPNQTTSLLETNDDENILNPGETIQQKVKKAIVKKEIKNVQKKVKSQLNHSNDYSIVYPSVDHKQWISKIELPEILSYDWTKIKAQNPPVDSALLKRLTQQLNDYQNHFQPEKVYLQFDRTFFKPGEAIWFSAYVRDANTLKASSKSDLVYVELNGPNGGNLKKITLVAENGRVRGDFQLGDKVPGGLYTIKAYTNWQKNQNHFFERKIQVQAVVLPKLRMELNMLREAYGPGDEVEAKLELKNLENKALSNQAFEYQLMLDGEAQKSYQGNTDSKGIANIKLDLPKILETTEGLVNISIEHKGQMESIARSIPIVLNKIDLQFLPEGGDLVETLSGKIAFKALNEFGKPADVEGHVMNGKGQQVATFRSYHQGMGAFDFQPEEGEYYYARITNPVGIEMDYALPKVMKRGYGLKVGKQENNVLHFDVMSTEAEALVVLLQSNGRIYESRTTLAREGTHQLSFPVDKLPIGIAQLTLFDSKEVPRAERLVFLNPDKKLDISITTDKEKYKPREKVSMTVEVKDERGLPMPGQFSLAVADDNLLTFADDKQGHILSYLLIESELNGTIEEPNFYFDPAEKHPEKDQLLALDYLMLTQGWRRFNWMDMQKKPTLVMEYEGERAILAGVVMDKKKNPVAGARIELVGAKNIRTFSDENGRFSFENVKRNESNRIEVLAEKNSIYRTFSTSNYGDDLEIYMDGPFVYNFKNLPNDKDYIQGQIHDSNGETLIGANVIVKGTTIGTVTDIDGNFSFKPGLGLPYDLVVSYTGYETKRVTINNPSELIDVEMNESGMLLDEVVVTGYGGIRRNRRAARRAKRKSKKAKKEVASVSKALEGKVAGIAQADEGDIITIRGSRSGDTNYYLDGIRISSSQLQSENKTQKIYISGTPARFENTENVGKQIEQSKGQKLEKQITLPQDHLGRHLDFVRGKMAIVDLNTILEKKKIAENFQTGFYQSRDFYMPAYTANEKVEVRDDFRPTIYWNPSIEVGRDGLARVEFFTNDEITTFRATVEGLAIDGGIGRKKHTFYSQLPFGMDVKIPERILSGDVILAS